MAKKKNGRAPPKPMWAYAYQLQPPQAADRLQAIKRMLERENAEAKRGVQNWAGNLVVEEQITHILVVSDSPVQTGEANRRLESALAELRAGFSVTAPMLMERANGKG